MKHELPPNYTEHKDDWTPNVAPERALNRAERRRYVKAVQSRTNRLHLMGFGSWRRHKPRTEPSYAALTAGSIATGPEQKAYEKAYNNEVYRAARKARLRQSSGRIGGS